MKKTEEQKLYERPATPHARKQCSQCANDCQLKNIKGTCKQFVDKEEKRG